MTIYTINEFPELFKVNGKRICPRTLRNRLEKGIIPTGVNANKTKAGWMLCTDRKPDLKSE